MAKIRTRIPKVKSRDPKTEKPTRSPQHYISAGKPAVCPDCGHNTRVSEGEHIDPVHKTILEYRECGKCGKPIAVGRKMTVPEISRYCSHAEAVREYNRGAK